MNSSFSFKIVGIWIVILFGMNAVPLRSQDPYKTNSIANEKDSFAWPENKRLAISLTFDDARPSQIDVGVPILDRYNVKATFYVSPGLMEERLEGWKNAVQRGHEIGNHSMNHPCTGNFLWSRQKALEDHTLRDMSNEIVQANQRVEELVGARPVSFAYPCGQKYIGRGENVQSYIPVIARNFISGRGWLDEGPNDPVFCDLAQLTGMELDGKSFDDVKILIENATEKGLWLVLAGHEIGDPGRQTSWASTLDAICQYAAIEENGVWLAPVGTIAQYVQDHPSRDFTHKKDVYLDPSAPIEARVEDLLSKMTLAEKVGQLNMPVLYSREMGIDENAKKEASKAYTAGTFTDEIGPLGGFFTMANHILKSGPLEQAAFFNKLQSIALDSTRLRIPLLQIEEGTHGLMCAGGTIFPEGLGLGSTWNLDLINAIYETVAREGRSVGIHELFTLVIEPIRDPRLGRNIEGYSEDPYLCAQYAKTLVRAIQGFDISKKDKAVAGLCHFPGQSQPVSGLERGAMEISERILREVFLPPWEAGICTSGALGVMATYPTLDGIPVHSSPEILNGILREELGFEGIVLSEGNGVNTLVYTGVAKDEKEAGAMAALSGMDVSISYNQGYYKELIENVKEGKVAEQIIDRSVRRVLQTKFKLGLFEQPFVNPEVALQTIHQKKHQDLALQAARESIILLKNENKLLPLSKEISSIAVIGPNANHVKNQLGDYVSRVVLQDVITVLEGIREVVGQQTKVEFVQGCNVVGNDLDEIDKAVEAAKQSQFAVVVVGENEWQTDQNQGTSGEGYDVATLQLTGMQLPLIKAVVATGTPTIVVLVNGRPLATPWIAEHVPALVEAWCPGEKGGQAVAELLFGEYNPSGKLSVTIPRHAGQLPVYYNYKPSKSYWLNKGWGNSYADISFKPLFPFGFGLSYTQFAYQDLQILPEKTGPFGKVKVSLTVKNTGNIAGDEVVQLYVRDVLSSVVRPVKELKGFQKIHLKPGLSQEVSFTLGPDALAFYNRSMENVIEPGTFKVMIGSSSEDIRLERHFEISEQ